MNRIEQAERETQNRVVRLIKRLGYRSLGSLQHVYDNAPVRQDDLKAWLRTCGHSEALITRAVTVLTDAAVIGGGRSLYDANRAVYDLLRGGAKVRDDHDDRVHTVRLIDWSNPEANDFAVAEEVTVPGRHTKRPDVVVYVNGIALGILELKRSATSVTEGIRQNVVNQQPEFIESFFATAQLVMAGNDSEGLRYGTVGTTEPYYLTWKEERAGWTPAAVDDIKYVAADDCDAGTVALDCDLARLLDKRRFLEFVHDFVVFDAGTKKLARHNQYFGVRAAQASVRRREGGIVWHTQGSGKSLTMVWLARWILENVVGSRVLIVTDREELDGQIEGVFTGVGETIYRTSSGADLVATLNEPKEPLICSLVHKFGKSDDASAAEFASEIQAARRSGYSAKGDVYVFVDEAHRTQSGTLHDAMRALLPNAVFVGFTGTPLLAEHKAATHRQFGAFIHTYRFDEAVADRVVRDIRYEARDVNQTLGSPERVDKRFEMLLADSARSDADREDLKQRWATLKKLYSSKERLQRIAADIAEDMLYRPRLKTGHGNAILVTGSVYEACTYYEIFESTTLKGRTAIVTSYRPHVSDINNQPTAEGKSEAQRKYDAYRRMLADHFRTSEEDASARVEEFERNVKKRFVKEPGQMKLLIVVDKLLTGFDAPSATYLYIDKPMRDHGLFQAICRVNRLDGDDKEYGYVVDYRDLFGALAGAIDDYTGGAFKDYDSEDVQGLLAERLDEAKRDLDDALDTVRALFEKVEPPGETRDVLHYFGTTEPGNAEALANTEPQRAALYKAVRRLVTVYADVKDEMIKTGYTPDEAASIGDEVRRYERTVEAVRANSGDARDTSYYDPHMRQLLDDYVQADHSRTVAEFKEMGLVEMIVERGIGVAEKALPGGIRESETTIAETIENNVRRVIIDKRQANPVHYDKMSDLLTALIEARRAKAVEYAEYLAQIEALSHQVVRPAGTSDYPASMDSHGRRALYDNLGRDEALASQVDAAIRAALTDDWRGNPVKEMAIQYKIKAALDGDAGKAGDVFAIIERQHEY